MPKKPGTYWDPPKSEELVERFSLHPLGLPEPKNSELLKAMKRLYELGSKAVHPRIGDMVETEELGWSADSKECMDPHSNGPNLSNCIRSIPLLLYRIPSQKNSRPRRQPQQENLEYRRSLYIRPAIQSREPSTKSTGTT